MAVPVVAQHLLIWYYHNFVESIHFGFVVVVLMIRFFLPIINTTNTMTTTIAIRNSIKNPFISNYLVIFCIKNCENILDVEKIVQIIQTDAKMLHAKLIVNMISSDLTFVTNNGSKKNKRILNELNFNIWTLFRTNIISHISSNPHLISE